MLPNSASTISRRRPALQHGAATGWPTRGSATSNRGLIRRPTHLILTGRVSCSGCPRTGSARIAGAGSGLARRAISRSPPRSKGRPAIWRTLRRDRPTSKRQPGLWPLTLDDGREARSCLDGRADTGLPVGQGGPRTPRPLASGRQPVRVTRSVQLSTRMPGTQTLWRPPGDCSRRATRCAWRRLKRLACGCCSSAPALLPASSPSSAQALNSLEDLAQLLALWRPARTPKTESRRISTSASLASGLPTPTRRSASVLDRNGRPAPVRRAGHRAARLARVRLASG